RTLGWAPLTSVRRGALKYIEAPRPELYDTRLDPAESHNLLAERPRETALFRDLVSTRGKELAALSRGPARGPDAEASAKLRALGYLSGSERTGEAGLDPKDGIDTLQGRQRAYEALAKGELEEAERLFRLDLEKFPHDHGVPIGLGRVLELRGRDPEARAAYLEALRRNPEGSLSLARLFALASRRGDRVEQLEIARRLVAAYPRSGASFRMQAEALEGLGRTGEAEASYVEAMRREPESFGTRLRWALFLAARGRLAEASRFADALAREAPANADVARLRTLIGKSGGPVSRASPRRAPHLGPEPMRGGSPPRAGE
ncbi:MAG: tetratricopeptide repeat protein, partial [Thermoanaerobaculia bacterium]